MKALCQYLEREGTGDDRRSGDGLHPHAPVAAPCVERVSSTSTISSVTTLSSIVDGVDVVVTLDICICQVSAVAFVLSDGDRLG